MSSGGVPLYQHRIYCVTEGCWAYAWTESTAELARCPNDTNHGVNPDSSSTVAAQAPAVVVVNKEPHGPGRVECVKIAMPAYGAGAASRSWPFDIAVYSMTAGVTTESAGCSLTLDVNPNTPAGVLTAPANAGDTAVAVSPTAAVYCTPGTMVSLQSGSATQVLGWVTQADATNGTLSVSNPVAAPFPVGTAVLGTTRVADGLVLPQPGYVTFGADRAVAKMIRAGSTMVFTTQNPNSIPTALYVYISYNY